MTVKTRARKFAAASAAAFLVLGLSIIDAPTATATDHKAAIGGSFEWGYKKSFRDYITGKVANGDIETSSGATYNGSTFSLPPVSDGTTVSGSSQGIVALQGQIHFTGHGKNNVNILDTTLSDFKLRFDGQKAEIIVDVKAREFKGTNYDSVGDVITTDDVALADVTLFNMPDLTSESIDLSGTAILSPAGARAFGGFYSAGETLDNTSGSLTLDGTASTGNGGSTTSGGSARECGAGALGVMSDGTEREGTQGMVQEVNDTFALWNNLLVNTDRMFCNLDNLQGRFKPEQSSGASSETASDTQVGASTAAATAVTPSPGSAVGATASNGVAGNTANSSSAVAGLSQAAAGAGNAVCTAEDTVGIAEATAQWGVKQSFQNYIRGSIAKGEWSLSGVGYENQQFLFAGSDGSVNPSVKSGTIRFPGTLHFVGHGGTLNLQMSNVEIRFADNSGEVIAEVASSDISGAQTGFGRTTLGTLGFTSLNVSGNAVSGDATVTLTAAGSKAFADFYEEGQQLDPISFQAALGGDARCSDAQTAGSDGMSSGDIGSVANSSIHGDSTSGTGVSATDGDSGQFQIHNAGQDSDNLATFGLDTRTTFMLIVAAFIVAGGSMTRFTSANPMG